MNRRRSGCSEAKAGGACWRGWSSVGTNTKSEVNSRKKKKELVEHLREGRAKRKLNKIKNHWCVADAPQPHQCVLVAQPASTNLIAPFKHLKLSKDPRRHVVVIANTITHRHDSTIRIHKVSKHNMLIAFN